MSHFLEHMVFKGTPRRLCRAGEPRLRPDRPAPTAYTSEEDTVYHAAVLPEYLPQVVDILAVVLRPSRRDEDFNIEKKVILEEIKMYLDPPRVGDWASTRGRSTTPTHPLANSVLGTQKSVGAPDTATR